MPPAISRKDYGKAVKEKFIKEQEKAQGTDKTIRIIETIITENKRRKHWSSYTSCQCREYQSKNQTQDIIMVTLFRKLLIRCGKVIPFVFAFIVAISHIESIYAILNENIILDMEGYYTYDVPISNYIGNIIYIDWFDVLLLYILAVALEFCKYNMRAVHYLLLNLVIRTLVERFYLDWWIIVSLASFMALFGLFCLYGGIKMIPVQKGNF